MTSGGCYQCPNCGDSSATFCSGRSFLRVVCACPYYAPFRVTVNDRLRLANDLHYLTSSVYTAFPCGHHIIKIIDVHTNVCMTELEVTFKGNRNHTLVIFYRDGRVQAAIYEDLENCPQSGTSWIRFIPAVDGLESADLWDIRGNLHQKIFNNVQHSHTGISNGMTYHPVPAGLLDFVATPSNPNMSQRLANLFASLSPQRTYTFILTGSLTDPRVPPRFMYTRDNNWC